jgi:hypothetical protein
MSLTSIHIHERNLPSPAEIAEALKHLRVTSTAWPLQTPQTPPNAFSKLRNTATIIMSSGAQPIDPARFAEALESLPLENLHAKAAELRNNIAHLKSSNAQMLPFADEGDDVCKEAMFENLAVIGRMNERIRLLREEVERRGMRWSEGEVEDKEGVNGHAEGEGQANGTANSNERAESGRLTDDELRRQLEERMDVDGEEDGVHL